MAGPAVLTVADTIARSFLKAAETRGDRPAIREKKFGIWQPTSWRQWLQISKDIAYGLHAIGFRPGDVASIIANAVPEWVYADMGILCAGGVSSGIYPTDSSTQVEYLVNDSRTRVDLRRRRRATRQASDLPGALPDAGKDHRLRHGRPERLYRSDGDVARRIHGAGAQSQSGQRSAVGGDDRKPQRFTISRSWSTPRAPQGRPRARCIPTAASPTRCATPTICFPRAMPRSGWCSCRSAMSPSGSAATTSRSRWGR